MLNTQYGVEIQIVGGPKDGDVLAFPAGAHIPNQYLMPEPVHIDILNIVEPDDSPAFLVREYDLRQRGDGSWVYMIGKVRSQ